ncbi:glutamate 5-kinase [Candidatus Poribacteria bacterium]|nr:glutamate 5-kinase [Candidatus Poribacteria bacterium]MBT5535052.1 glutamate 5-kinase [Candidatus Poribacteria bacterium]MBT5713354.1 glutamate 5-kinase [Candidatus Poribacteria bacterium]MBT7807537.1 glutamate 5-kinase [Candidatus Poribacteria bacterium]
MKVGTATLTNGTRALDAERASSIVRQISEARAHGIEVVLVTSGAIGVGVGRLGLPRRPTTMGSLQAAASVGQNILMNTYETLFRGFDTPVGQVLVTAGDLADRRRYVNFGNALNALFEYGVVPVVNENDSVSVDEIRVGDNDTLAAHVANAIEADLLILLTDTDGVYTADPHTVAGAARIPFAAGVTAEMLDIANESPTRKASADLGTGRLATKVRAAEIVTSSGIPMALADGARDNAIGDILDGADVGTFFAPTAPRAGSRKRWIAHTLSPKGSIVADAGAFKAVRDGGKSLLPAGIKDVVGTFAFGDPVRCVTEDGVEFARGLVNYTADEITRIRGRRTDAIQHALGYHYADEVIHRDNLVLVERGACIRDASQD